MAANMPADVQDKLDRTLASLRRRFRSVRLQRSWQSTPEMRNDFETKLAGGPYWRARIVINEVSTRWWYSTKRERWLKSA